MTNNATPVPMQMATPDEGEELQRAELYGLLARLWYAPPDAALREMFVNAVTEAPEPGSFLEAPWQDVVAAVRAASLEATEDEYSLLFLSAGKADIFLYASSHLSGALNEKPLVDLRTDLTAMGLTSDAASTETEDHVSFIFEVMRYLIAGDDMAVCNLEQQRRLFRAHIQPWVGTLLCDAVEQHPKAKVYAALARFTRAYLEVEAQAFDLIE